jgi:LPS sulfotransferase NodH
LIPKNKPFHYHYLNPAKNMIEKIKPYRDYLNFHLELLATDLDLFNSHLDYSKFIILGQGRSGSNMLIGLLNSHSQVVSYGELFLSAERINWGFPKHDQYLYSQKILSLRNNNSEKFLKKHIFKRYPTPISAVGFKLFYSHAKGDASETVWNFLKNRQDIKIIHIKRNNFLKSFLSYQKALITDEWLVISQKGISNQPKDMKIYLDAQDCLDHFNYMQNSMLEYDLFFEQHQKIDVTYEALSTDYPSVMRQVQDFLKVDQETLEPNTVKQSSLSLSESITNYFELKEQFQNTLWSVFFED